jgi:putative FmdB family regulatory protein
MPIYEYECSSCGALIEQLELHDTPPPKCCNAFAHRIVSMPSPPVLRGMGFYATEYGPQARHLGREDRAHRAARDCKERTLQVAKPQRTNQGQAQQIHDLAKYGG